MEQAISPTIGCPCNGAYRERAFAYDARPEGETEFELGAQSYRRSYDQCRLCRHWFGAHSMDLHALYDGAYSAATYGDQVEATFDRIINLPPEQSDNAGRVDRVASFVKQRFDDEYVPSLLDVGAGLGVFPYAMHRLGWRCTALDPDPRATGRIQSRLGIASITADFMTVTLDDLGTYDVVSLNKVIEHVEDPRSMLERAAAVLNPRGVVYIEVPDAEVAQQHGPGREEFFIEHHHVFSAPSLSMTVERSGLEVVSMSRLTEPSTKFTLACFAERR